MRPAFDAAARGLVECAQLVDPNTDAVSFLEHADERGRYAWSAIKEHVHTLDRAGVLVSQFSCKTPVFNLVELPALGGSGFLSDVALLCVDPKYPIERSSEVFSQPGDRTHRKSPWFLAAPTLHLCSIAEARETVRTWAESAWEGLGLNNGRGRMEGKIFVPMPIPNPYARKVLTA